MTTDFTDNEPNTTSRKRTSLKHLSLEERDAHRRERERLKKRRQRGSTRDRPGRPSMMSLLKKSKTYQPLPDTRSLEAICNYIAGFRDRAKEAVDVCYKFRDQYGQPLHTVMPSSISGQVRYLVHQASSFVELRDAIGGTPEEKARNRERARRYADNRRRKDEAAAAALGISVAEYQRRRNVAAEHARRDASYARQKAEREEQLRRWSETLMGRENQ